MFQKGRSVGPAHPGCNRHHQHDIPFLVGNPENKLAIFRGKPTGCWFSGHLEGLELCVCAKATTSGVAKGL